MREFDVTLQFCLAHLIRDVKFLMTLPDKKEQAYGTALREALRTLFGVIHQREQMPKGEFQRRVGGGRAGGVSVGPADAPRGRQGQGRGGKSRKQSERKVTYTTKTRGQPEKKTPP